MGAKQRKVTFLIVENDPNDAFLIKRALDTVEECGASAVCRNLSEAKAYLSGAGMYKERRLYPVPEVIIADLRIDSESGLELVDWIRKQGPPVSKTVIIILSGSATPLQMDAAAKVGADKVVTKPNKLEELQAVLKAIAIEFCSKTAS